MSIYMIEEIISLDIIIEFSSRNTREKGIDNTKVNKNLVRKIEVD